MELSRLHLLGDFWLSRVRAGGVPFRGDIFGVLGSGAVSPTEPKIFEEFFSGRVIKGQ